MKISARWHPLVFLALVAHGATSCAITSDDQAEELESSEEDSAHAEADLSCDIDDTISQGESTYYAADGSGACSFPASPENLNVVALNPEDFAGSNACGACIEVDGPGGSVNARVVDLCPGCAAGDIDLSAEAFAQIAEPDQGRVPVSWRFVACEAEEPIRYHFKEGSNPFWTAVQVRNHRHPIASVEIKAGDGDYKMATRSAYNYFIVAEGGMGEGPYDFRVRDVLGNVLEDQNIAFSPDTVAPGQAQFQACGEVGKDEPNAPANPN